MKKTILSLALVLTTGLIFAQKKTTTPVKLSFPPKNFNKAALHY